MAPKKQAVTPVAEEQQSSSQEPEDLHAKIETLQQQLTSLLQQQQQQPGMQAGILNQGIAIMASSFARFPQIQLITPKLDGKPIYHLWSTIIEAIAQSLDIWELIQYSQYPLVQHLQHANQYARSLLILNMIPSL